MDKLQKAITLAQSSLGWLEEAPIVELEAVESAIGQNAPIKELTELVTLLRGLI